MNDECCNIKVTEMDDGYRVEVTGKKFKDHVQSVMKKCCTEGKPWKEFMKDCCPSDK